MSVLFTDNFNRANSGTLGASWTDVVAGWSVASNQAVPASASNASVWNGGPPPADCYAEVKVVTLPTGSDEAGILLRVNTGTLNGYGVGHNAPSGNTRILRLDAGASTVIATLSSAVAAGDTLRLEVRGTSFRALVNGVVRASVTDATYNVSQVSGMSSTGTTAVFDDFETGSFPTASAGTVTGITASAATIGCTTGQNTGTIYVVVDTVANLSGVTDLQVVAGLKASGAAAAFNFNNAVSTTSPSVSATGLSSGATYGYAIVHRSGGNSGVLTGSFTTTFPIAAYYFRA
jgi:hypothetical protein